MTIQQEEDLKKMTFIIDYPNLYHTAYEIDDKHPGLVLTDKDFIDRQSRVVKWLLQKISSSIIKGQSIMNISLPIFIFDQRTMLQVFAYELRLAPYFLERAFHTPNSIEKLKWVTTFLLAQIFVSPLQTKPFNPILGETFQTKIGNMNIYCEQTVNKPPTANFYCYDDERTYKYYGYIATTASTGANSCKALKLGKIMLEFKDGAKYRIYYPAVWISGTMMGKKLFNYKNTCLVVDEVNQYGSLVKFNPGGDKGLFSKMFSSKKQKGTPDIFEGNIYQMKDIEIDTKGAKHKRVDKKATSYGAITGKWTENVLFDNEVFWNREDNVLLDMIEPEYKLPSDSCFRSDLKIFLTGKEDEAQEEKEKLEENQRRDRRLREGTEKENQKEEKDEQTKKEKDDKAKAKAEKEEKHRKEKEEKAKAKAEKEERHKKEKEEKAKAKAEKKEKEGK